MTKNIVGQNGAGIDADAIRDGDTLANWLTMAGHMCTDINQGALNATLPFLIASGMYTYTSAVMLVFVSNIASAVIQPLFGWIGDRKSCPWFMALGCFLAGLGMMGVGFASDYATVLLCATVCGTGVAMFHPEGGRIANLAAGSRKGNGMSIFAVGGNVGFFVGSLLTAAFLTAFGMHGTFVFVIPSTICAITLLAFYKRFQRLGKTFVRTKDSADSLVKEHWNMFGMVMASLSLRAIFATGLMAFIPLFIMGEFGQTEAFASSVIALFSVAGAVATFLSGRAGERFGAHSLLTACMIAATVGTLAFAFNSSLIVALALTALLAIVVDLCYPSIVAVGMSYVPKHLGTASGLTYGVAVSVGGAVEPFLGMAGDAVGLVPVMLILVGVGVVATIFSIVLHRADNRLEKSE